MSEVTGPYAPPWRGALKQGAIRTGEFAVFLLKTILPWYVITEILKASGILAWMASFVEPVMAWWHLPAEAAAAIIAGMFVNIYAAVAVIAGLGLTPEQITVLGLLLGICHQIPVETAIVRELVPGKQYHLALLRVVLGFGASWILAQVIL